MSYVIYNLNLAMFLTSTETKVKEPWSHRISRFMGNKGMGIDLRTNKVVLITDKAPNKTEIIFEWGESKEFHIATKEWIKYLRHLHQLRQPINIPPITPHDLPPYNEFISTESGRGLYQAYTVLTNEQWNGLLVVPLDENDCPDFLEGVNLLCDIE